MPVIIHDLQIEAEDEKQNSESDSSSAQEQQSQPFTPLDLRDIRQREIEREYRIRAH